MRLITINAPEGEGSKVANIAFNKGIKEVATSSATLHRINEESKFQDVINIETTTPGSKLFIEALMHAPFYDPQLFSFSIRHPESIFGNNPVIKEIHPVTRPTVNVYQELYQFSKITFSLAGRIFLSAVLLCYGMVNDFVPLVIAGLLFLPYHHFMIAIALGIVIKEWQFTIQAFVTLIFSTVLIFIAGALTALFCAPPVLFELKGNFISGILLAGIIGVAAALASIDDAGRRELIGLAATAHISIIPAWIGLQLVFGGTSLSSITEHLFPFLINIIVLIVVTIFVFVVVKMKGYGIRRFVKSTAK